MRDVRGLRGNGWRGCRRRVLAIEVVSCFGGRESIVEIGYLCFSVFLCDVSGIELKRTGCFGIKREMQRNDRLRKED